MKVCGIIAEYDPFHRGHLYHLTRARALSEADFVVCVLGTAFAQRGTPAYLSTRARTEMALKNGADAVFSLPVSFTMADAERFAYGGVYLLNALQCVTHLSFGAETDDLPLLQRAAQCLETEPPELKAALLSGLQGGLSHAQARGRALERVLGASCERLFAPNNTLAVCYLRTLTRLSSPMIPLPVKRLGAYRGGADGFLSATDIRALCEKRDFAALAAALPAASYAIVQSALQSGDFCPPDALDQALLYRLKTMDRAALRALPGIGEGLENRLMRLSPAASSREELLGALKTKRYTYARLSRCLCAALLGLKADHLPPAPGYARLLGFSTRALPLLKRIKASGFPLIAKNADAREALAADAFAESLWALGARRPDTFYKESPFINKTGE